jgi:hypothetical protein
METAQPNEPEPQPEPEGEPVVQEPEEEPVIAEPEEMPQGASPRAQQRIRELAAQRKASEDRADRLETAMAELLSSQARQSRHQEYLLSEQAARTQAEKSKQGEEALLAKFKALGFNEQDVSHWMAFESIQKAEAAEQKLKAFEEHQLRREREQLTQRYESSLRKELETQAKRFQLDAEQVEDLYEHAYALARAKQLRDPAEAVAITLKPIAKALTARPKAASKRPDAQDPMHNAISTRGRAGERRAGDSPNGSAKKRDVEDIEREWGAGRFD